jgi:hypothetical protein
MDVRRLASRLALMRAAAPSYRPDRNHRLPALNPSGDMPEWASEHSSPSPVSLDGEMVQMDRG